MIPVFILESLALPPALVAPGANLIEHISNGVLVTKGCSEVKRWYAWTRCGDQTCCKLFIACSDGTIVSQTVDSAQCH